MWGEVWTERREGVGRRRRKRHARGRTGSRLGRGQGTREAHVERLPHVRDLGRVKVQRLVEGVRVLPSRKGGACDAGRGACREAGGRGVVVARAACTGKRPDSRLGGLGTRGAHVEHLVQVQDLGGVKVQRLVEGVRVLPSQKGGACDAGRGAGREAGGPGVVVARAACTGKRPDSRLGGQGTRGAHAKHAVNVGLGGVKVHRLVEGVRVLPSRREEHAIWGEVRAGRRWVVARRKRVYAHGEGSTQGLGARARAERTRNMLPMSVILEVSMLSGWLNAFACCRVEGHDRGHAMRGEVRAGRWEGLGWWWRERHARGKGPTQGLGAGAHLEHAVQAEHDLGGVKAQRLVELLRVLPAKGRSMRYGARCGPGGGG